MYGNVRNALGVGALVLLALPFAYYAVGRGASMGAAEEQAGSRLFHADDWAASLAVYTHMVTGGLLTALAPLQVLRGLRVRWPKVHHRLGFVVFILAVVTGVAGLFYIVAQDTIGGWPMSLGFGLYGVLTVGCAARTVQLARRRDAFHGLWAERLVILALASWLYRVHYGIWEIATGGAASRPDFSGVFDLVQVFAFYLPYLALHWIWRRKFPIRT